MRGLPKFLLPCSEGYETLLERHVDFMLETCEVVLVPIRPHLSQLLESLNIVSDRVKVIPLETESMTETVVLASKFSNADRFVVAMPDTYLLGEQPYSYLAQDKEAISLALWQIREDQKGKLGQVLLEKSPEGKVSESQDKNPACDFPHSWGAMGLNREVLELADPSMPHVGYLIAPAIEQGYTVAGKEMQGQYYDCGTPSEYVEMLGNTFGSNHRHHPA
jgi:UTP-glucose-1-phosphate uridylyltransferase